jgi:hypothetical protein
VLLPDIVSVAVALLLAVGGAVAVAVQEGDAVRVAVLEVVVVRLAVPEGVIVRGAVLDAVPETVAKGVGETEEVTVCVAVVVGVPAAV